MKTLRKIPVSFAATAKEMSMIELIKETYKRSSVADVFRFLVLTEAEKILKQKDAIASNKP